MKHLLKYLPVFLVLASCTPGQDEPVVAVAPEVSYAANFTDTSAKLGETLSFDVELLKGSRVTLLWYVDDVLEASGSRLTYTFSKPGVHVVRFIARNGSGETGRECRVDVENKLAVSLSYDDSGDVEMYLYSKFNCVATVLSEGIEVSHKWFIDEVLVCTEAWLRDFPLGEVRPYKVRYHAECSLGSLDREFTVNVIRIPLEVGFSVPAGEVSIERRTTLDIVAAPLYDGVVTSQTWKIDGKFYSSDKDFSFLFENEGLYFVEYEALNPDGFAFTASWDVSVTAPYRVTVLLTDFENDESLPACFLTSGSTKLEVIDNPFPSSVNPSGRCMLNQVDSDGSTSGYFTFSYSGAVSMGVNVSAFTGIRFKIYLGDNKYLPLIEFKGTRYAPVEKPSYNGGWETLEYDFGMSINAYATFRPMLDLNGNNVGARSATNNKIVYFDDIELF